MADVMGYGGDHDRRLVDVVDEDERERAGDLDTQR